MAEDLAFTVSLEHVRDYEFTLKFDWGNLPDLTLDEAAPLGAQKGPNASRLLAGAVVNCLSASLLFCLRKSRIEPKSIRAEVTGHYTRNEKGRLRLGDLAVTITLDAGAENSARLARCTELFEDYCVVTQSVRHGIPVSVAVRTPAGELLYRDHPD